MELKKRNIYSRLQAIIPIKMDPIERIIEIESKVDFDAVRYVTVLKRKES